MKANDCDWANRNQVLQKELRDTLTSALQDTEHEDHSLSSLEKVYDPLNPNRKPNVSMPTTH